MPKKGANISLSSYDDIFETDASRAEAKQERIQSISILDLVPFENHPFKVVDDEAMLRTTESQRASTDNSRCLLFCPLHSR